ncbi:MAG: hypothetical protein H7250_08330 [Flavobacterium sp.]|nr:hypothetical protein [Flavobacterium sp.]
MENNLLEAIDNLTLVIEGLKSEIYDLKKSNETLSTSVNILKEYVSTIE